MNFKESNVTFKVGDKVFHNYFYENFSDGNSNDIIRKIDDNIYVKFENSESIRIFRKKDLTEFDAMIFCGIA